MPRRVVLIILDSVGIGELPDAHEYGDKGSSTLANIAKQIGKLKLPNLERLGLGNITQIMGVAAADKPVGNFGKMKEVSPGKDTTTGHWEMAGIILEKPFRTFPNGFPDDFIKKFEETIGRKILGNEVASGTEIINHLGEEHMKTGKPIVYTSADSVFQIAAHEEIIPLEEQMEICLKARAMLTGDMEVSRVIARPFLGEPGSFYRTSNRHDFAIEPPHKIFLENIVEGGHSVYAVGKIKDIYTGRGVTESVRTKDNSDGVDQTLHAMDSIKSGLIMANLVDFDMLFGHRNNVKGYAQALEEFDMRLPEILMKLRDEDLLIITADHGCDPTTSSTDHSREYVPLLAYGHHMKSSVNLGIRKTFADLGATVVDYLEVKALEVGESFYPAIKGVM